MPLGVGVVYLFIYSLRNNVTEIVKYLAVIAFVAFLYMILTDTSTISSETSSIELKRFLSKFYQMFMMFMPLLFLKTMIDSASRQQKTLVLSISLLLITYVVITTAGELASNPNVTRDWSGFAESSGNNVASYYFVYAIPMMIAICMMAFFRVKNNWAKTGLIALIIGQIYFLLLAQYTLSVLIAFIGICYEIEINTKNSRGRALIMLGIAALILLSPSIVRVAAQYVPSEQMSIRFFELYNLLTGGDASGYNLNGRLELYKRTIMAFLNSPVWGNRTLPFDGHATLLTVLADLGLLGGIPFYYLYFSSNAKVKKIIGDKTKQFAPFFLMLILMGFTNPIHSSLPLAYSTWLVAPLSIFFFNERTNNDNI